MKRFRPFPELLAAIEQKLTAARPSFYHSPLEDVTQLLCDGRHYAWVGIYLAVAAPEPQPLLEAGTDSDSAAPSKLSQSARILVPMKLGRREVGALAVESHCPDPFYSQELVFLEQVADVIARYLAGPGKFLVRRARSVAGTTVPE